MCRDGATYQGSSSVQSPSPAEAPTETVDIGRHSTLYRLADALAISGPPGNQPGKDLFAEQLAEVGIVSGQADSTSLYRTGKAYPFLLISHHQELFHTPEALAHPPKTIIQPTLLQNCQRLPDITDMETPYGCLIVRISDISM